MSGGPVMNLLIAVVLLGAVFMGIGIKEPSRPWSAVSDCVIPASEAARSPVRAGRPGVAGTRPPGFQAGDELVSLNGSRSRLGLVQLRIRASAERRVTVVVERDGEPADAHHRDDRLRASATG